MGYALEFTLRERFRYYANRIADGVGSPGTFGAALVIVLAWAVAGPMFHYSDTWQLVINTATSVVTFLMVFLIQNTQNRDAAAMQLKLNELIRAMSTARNTMVDLGELYGRGNCGASRGTHSCPGPDCKEERN